MGDRVNKTCKNCQHFNAGYLFCDQKGFIIYPDQLNCNVWTQIESKIDTQKLYKKILEMLDIPP